MYKFKKFLQKNSGEAVVLVICFLFLCIAAAKKEGFHMDEMISYEFANSYYTPWVVPTQPEGRLAKFVRNEIADENFLVTISNLADNVVDLVKNGSSSKAMTYEATVYDEPVWMSKEVMQDLMTTGQKKSFHYTSVYFNVKDDNHPPLHYMALHTISSFFWYQVSPLAGLIVNMIFVTLTIVMVMQIGQNLAEICGFDEQKHAFAVTAGLLYGICAGTIATLLLIRMYAMLTFFCVALFAQHVNKWRINGFDRGNKAMIFIMICGFLTHYYFVFYAAVLALVNLILLVRRGETYGARGYIRSIIKAAIIGLILFPFAISDLTSSGRGVEATSNLLGGFSGFGERLAAFRKILGSQTGIFGLLLIALLWGIAALVNVFDKIFFPPKPDTSEPVHDAVDARQEIAKSREALQSYIGFMDHTDGEETKETTEETTTTSKGVFGGLKEKLDSIPMMKQARECREAEMSREEKRKDRERKYRILFAWLLLVPAIVFYLFIVKVSPYLVDRYIMAVYPFVALSSVFCVFCFWNVCNKKKSSIIWLYVTLVIMGGFQIVAHRSYNGEYYYKGYKEQVTFAKEHEKTPCICVYDGYGFYENMAEFIKYPSTLLVKIDELENRKDKSMPEAPEGIVLVVKGDVDLDKVISIMKDKYGYQPEGELALGEAHGDRYGVFVKK